MNAIRHLHASIEKHPEDPLAWKILGDTQARAGLAEEALKAYRRGIALATASGDLRIAKQMELGSAIIKRHGL